MKNKDYTKKELRVIETLERLKTVPTSRISNEIKSNYFSTLTILEELLKRKVIQRIKSNKYVYWELR